MIDLSICIPAHNEDAILAQTVESVICAIPSTITWQIVLVDDASSDSTREIMKRIQARHPDNVTLVVLRKQQGLGGALPEGFGRSTGRLVTWLPADGEYSAREVLAQVPNELESELIVFQRIRREQPARNVLSLALNVTVRAMFGVALEDFCGIFIIRKSNLEILNVRSRSTLFTIEVLIAATKIGWTISGKRIKWKPRAAGKSSVFTRRGVLTSMTDLITLKLRGPTRTAVGHGRKPGAGLR